MARYKWDSAREWLQEKIDTQGKVPCDGCVALHDILNTVLTHVDNDDIQDDFQSEMESDGFFHDLDITEKLTGPQCIELLIEAGEDEVDLVDGEISVEQMRQKVQQYIEDGALAYEDVERCAG